MNDTIWAVTVRRPLKRQGLERKGGAAGNRTQGLWLKLPVLCHWATTPNGNHLPFMPLLALLEAIVERYRVYCCLRRLMMWEIISVITVAPSLWLCLQSLTSSTYAHSNKLCISQLLSCARQCHDQQSANTWQSMYVKDQSITHSYCKCEQ